LTAEDIIEKTLSRDINDEGDREDAIKEYELKNSCLTEITSDMNL
jgi:hypothetical protein